MRGSLASLERRLREEGAGETLFDAFSRGRYATDASHYQITPLGIVVPRTTEEAKRALAIAREAGVPVLPRGGGTSQSGQTINEALVVDCSKYLDNIIELNWQLYLCSNPPFLMQTRTDRRMRDYTDLAFKGEHAKARAVRDSLEPVRDAIKRTQPPEKPHAHAKYWQELLGQAGGRVRHPMLELTEAEKAKVREAFTSCGLKGIKAPIPAAAQ